MPFDRKWIYVPERDGVPEDVGGMWHDAAWPIPQKDGWLDAWQTWCGKLQLARFEGDEKVYSPRLHPPEGEECCVVCRTRVRPSLDPPPAVQAP